MRVATTMMTMLFALCHCKVFGWGTEGHEIVANIAYSRLSDDVRSTVDRILGPVNGTDQAGSSLAAVADWADRVRFYYHWSAPLHYIDVRDDIIHGGCHAGTIKTTSDADRSSECEFLYVRDCSKNVCVAGAIQNYSMQLLSYHHESRDNVGEIWHVRGSKSRGTSDLHSIREALKFLTHFIGDIHQPLHVSRTTDKGGNDIHVKFPLNTTKASRRRSVKETSVVKGHHGWNLHSVWDSGIIDKAIQEVYKTRSAFEQELIDLCNNDTYRSDVSDWLACADGTSQECTIEWGRESFRNAMEWAYDNVDGKEIQNNTVLTEGYYATRLPIVTRRLMAGGVRLAATLESILGRPMIRGSVLSQMMPSLRLSQALAS